MNKNTKIERKNCVWKKKYERLSEVCFVQHIEKKKIVFTFQEIKGLVSTTVESSQLAATHILIILFMDQNLTNLLIGVDGTRCFTKTTSRDYEKEKSSPVLKKLLRQSQSSTPEHRPRKPKITPFMA